MLIYYYHIKNTLHRLHFSQHKHFHTDGGSAMITESLSLKNKDHIKLSINRLNYIFLETEHRISKVIGESHPIKDHLKQLHRVLITMISASPKSLKINLLWELIRDTHSLIDFVFLDYFIYFDVTPVELVHEKLQNYYDKWLRLLGLGYGDQYHIELSYCVIYIITDVFFGVFLVQLTSLTRYSFGMLVGIALLTSTIGLKINMHNTNYKIGDLAGGLVNYQLIRQYIFFKNSVQHQVKQSLQHDLT